MTASSDALPDETVMDPELWAAWSHWLNVRADDECDTWHAFEAGWKARSVANTNAPPSLAEMLDNLEYEEDPRE